MEKLVHKIKTTLQKIAQPSESSFGTVNCLMESCHLRIRFFGERRTPKTNQSFKKKDREKKTKIKNINV